MSEAENITVLTLERSEALVLFELLASTSGSDCIPLRTPAEKLVIARLHGSLESVLVEPFMPDYDSTVERARTHLMSQTSAV